MLPGVVLGVLVGVQLIGRFSARQLNIVIGCLAVAFVVFHLTKEKIFRAEGAFSPNWTLGSVFGVATGITSTFAHGAGPVMSMYLIPQRMAKEVFVSTTVLIFFWVNWIKMPFFIIDRGMIDLPLFTRDALIHAESLKYSAWLFPLVPVGVWIGVWMNRRFSEQRFLHAIYLLTFLTGVQLIFQFNVAGWLRALLPDR